MGQQRSKLATMSSQPELNEKDIELLLDVVQQAWAQQMAYAIMNPGIKTDHGELKTLEMKLHKMKASAE